MSTAVVEQPTKLDSQETPPFPVMRLTLQQYWDLRDAGVLNDTDSKYEFLQGWIVPKMTQLPPHAWTVTQVNEILRPLFPDGWMMRTQCAINTDDSEPEPDNAVVRGPNTKYATRHPRGTEIGLLIEVAESTLRQDRRKAEIYAAENIPVYWIINLPDRQIEEYSQPDAATQTYLKTEIHPAGSSITFQLDGKVIQTIPVKDLLPPVAP